MSEFRLWSRRRLKFRGEKGEKNLVTKSRGKKKVPRRQSLPGFLIRKFSLFSQQPVRLTHSSSAFFLTEASKLIAVFLI